MRITGFCEERDRALVERIPACVVGERQDSSVRRARLDFAGCGHRDAHSLEVVAAAQFEGVGPIVEPRPRRVVDQLVRVQKRAAPEAHTAGTLFLTPILADGDTCAADIARRVGVGRDELISIREAPLPRDFESVELRLEVCRVRDELRVQTDELRALVEQRHASICHRVDGPHRDIARVERDRSLDNREEVARLPMDEHAAHPNSSRRLELDAGGDFIGVGLLQIGILTRDRSTEAAQL